MKITADCKAVAHFFKDLQENICLSLQQLDGSKVLFKEDAWQREKGGGGHTRIFQKGNLIEKGGVNYAYVHGSVSEEMHAHFFDTFSFSGEASFFATGISIVLHPQNPYIPIIHMNLRLLSLQSPLHASTQWLGGGIDLTPHYVCEKERIYFHQQLKQCCDGHDKAYYPRFSKWAARYFYLPHRQETRGIGGIFFDRLSFGEKERAFVMSLGQLFTPLYRKLVAQKRDKKYGRREKTFQAIRRGRYVEFNLLHDKGTQFGFKSGGRTESILMSLPPARAMGL